MDDHIQFWLESAENPPDFYQLLGRKCLDPDRRELQRTASAVYQKLHRYQTHSDAVIVRRARTLQDAVARAAGMLEDESAWAAYEQSQMERLAAGYSDQLQHHPASAAIDSVGDWLRHRGEVHPDRIAELAEAVLSQLASPAGGEPAPAAGGSARQRSSRLFSRTPVLPVPETRESEQTPERSPGAGNRPPKPPPRKKRPPDRKLPSIDEALVAAPVVAARPAPPAPVPAVNAPAPRPGGNVPVAAAGANAQAASHLWMIGAAVVSAAGLVAIVGGILLVHSWTRPAPAPDRSLVDSTNSSARPVERWSDTGLDDEEFDTADSNTRSTDSREEPVPPDAGDEPGPDEDVEETSAGAPAETGTSPGDEPPEDAAPPPEETTPPAEESDPAPPPEDDPAAAATTGQGGLIIRNASPAQCIAWSPDGTRLACGTSDGTIRICSADTGEEQQQLLGHTDAVLALAWHPNGNLLASAGVDGTVHVWKPDDGTETRLAGDGIAVNSIAWLSEHMLLAAGNSSGSLRRLSVQSNSSRRHEELDAGQPAGAVRALDVLEDRSREMIVTLHFDGSLLFWNRDEPLRGILPVDSGLFAGLPGTDAVLPSENVTPSAYSGGADLAVDSSGHNIAVALGGPIRLWNIEHGACAAPGRLLCGRGDVDGDEVPDGYGTVAWSGDDRRLAAGDATGRVSCWDTTTWKLVFFANCPARINDTAWNPADPQVLAIACDDNTVRIYSMSGRTRAVSLASDPMFQRSALITEADAFLADDEMPSLRLVVDVLAMYQVDAATEQELQRYRYELRKAAVALLNGMPAGSLPGDRRMPDWNQMLDLHQVMYLDPDGPSGEEARDRLLELFGVRHARSRSR